MEPDIYRLTGPTSWPSPPDTFSFSLLESVAACPRRWQLQRAKYGTRNGFPQRPSPAALEGTIIHELLDGLFKALGKAGFPTIATVPFAHAMKQFGLHRRAMELRGKADEQLAQHARGAGLKMQRSAQDLANEVVLSLRRQYIARDTPPWTPSSVEAGAAVVGKADLRGLLGTHGSLSEVRIKHPTLPFLGVIDLVKEEAGAAVVTDFKTGAHSDKHRTQVLQYAATWWRNTGQRVAATELAYLDKTERVPCTEAQLELAEKDLSASIAATQQTLGAKPAPAKVGDVCRWCDVRQLCAEYWLEKLPAVGHWVDLEGNVDGPVGVASAGLKPMGGGRRLELVFQPGTPSARNIVSGERLRILGARQEPSGTFMLSGTTEVFRLAGPSKGKQ